MTTNVDMKKEDVFEMLNNSKHTARMLDQLGHRQSIIHQGEISNMRKNKRHAAHLATYYLKHNLPDQIWYDSLRPSDDGSYSKVCTITN